MAVMVRTEGTATRFGWWLGQAVRAAVAALVLGGLLGAALGAARSVPPAQLTADLDAGRVVEVTFTESNAYVPGLVRGANIPVVRWKVVGSGWRTADLTADAAGAQVQDRVQTAGVPISAGSDRAARLLVSLAILTGMVLVLVLLGSPQPRRATKWAWFWLLLVPGGLGQLAWLAFEAPWSTAANRRPEPWPHQQQTHDTRLTGGRALLIAVVLGVVTAGLGTVAADWLAG